MKVIVLRNIMVGGKPVAPGAEIDLPEKDAKYLANVGKVKLKPGAAAKKKGPKEGEGEGDDGQVGDKETADSKQAKGREKR